MAAPLAPAATKAVTNQSAAPLAEAIPPAIKPVPFAVGTTQIQKAAPLAYVSEGTKTV